MRAFFPFLASFLLAVSAHSQDSTAPVPSGEQLALAEEKFRDAYKEDNKKTDPEGRKAFAKRLAEDARGTHDEPALKYVLLRESAQIAAAVGDAEGALAAIKEMAAAFAVDRWKLSVGHLEIASKSADSDPKKRGLATLYVQVAEDALVHEKFEACEDAASAAQRLVLEVRDLAGQLEQLAKEREEIRALAKEWSGAVGALKAKPDDGAACATIGRLLCALRSDWTAGLDYFTKSGEPSLLELAAQEAGKTDAAKARFELGCAWWRLAEAQSGRVRRAIRARAVDYYELAIAMPDLAPTNKKIATDRVAAFRETEKATTTPAAAKKSLPPLGKELLVNGGSEQAMRNGVIPGWDAGVWPWHRGNKGAEPSAGSGYFSASNTPGREKDRAPVQAELAQTVDLRPYADFIDKGEIVAALSFDVVTHHKPSGDSGFVYLYFFDKDGQQLPQALTSGPHLQRTWFRVSEDFKVPSGARSVRVVLQSRMKQKKGFFSNDAHFDNVSLKLKRT
jgi:hypothetical protein